MATQKTAVPVVAPPPVDPSEYSQWATQAETQQKVPAHRNLQAVQTVNTQGQTVTSVPDATSPEAAQSSFDNIPVFQLLDPSTAPSAWNTTNPSQQIYVGSTDNVKMGHNMIIGAIADKLGIKQRKGESTQTLEDAVTSEIVKQHNVKRTPEPSYETDQGGPGLLGQLEDALTGRSAGPDTPPPVDDVKPKLEKDPKFYSSVGDVFSDAAKQAQAGAKATPGMSVNDPSTAFVPGESPQVRDIVKAMHLTVGANQDPWEAIANKIGVNTSTTGNPQVLQIAQAESGFRSMLNTPGKIAAFQQRLEAAGMFTDIQQSGATEEYVPGVFDTATQQAIGTLLGETADNNKIVNGKVTKSAVTWNDVLNSNTALINENGGIQAVAKTAQSKIPQATDSQMESPAIQAFQSRLGRAPSASELAALTSSYDQQQVAKYTGAGELSPDINTGIMSAPGVARPTQAAAQFADQNDQTEAMGHSVLAAGSILANIIGGNVSNVASTGAPNAAVTDA
jgi:hypothetical protein